MNLDSARKTSGSFPQLLSLKSWWREKKNPCQWDTSRLPSMVFGRGPRQLRGVYRSWCNSPTRWTALPGAPSQAWTDPLSLPPPRCSTILNPKRSSFLSERALLSGSIWRLGVYIEIRDCFATPSSHSLSGFYRTSWWNLFHCNITRFRRNTLRSPLSLVCAGEKNLILQPETWKGAKSGRLFLKTREVANSIFVTFEFSQTVLEYHENLPSFHCQKGKKKNRMPLKFCELFPYTFLKRVCLTRISLVISLGKSFFPNEARPFNQLSSIFLSVQQ